MADNTNNQKPTITPYNHDQNVGQRGDNSGKSGLAGDGDKKHGDDLEAIIPKGEKGGARATPEPAGRPTRPDGDNDDLGEPGSAASGSERGYPKRS